MTILCLAHTADDRPNGCPRRDECQRHLAFRSNQFPEADAIIGSACAQDDYVAFLEVPHADD